MSGFISVHITTASRPEAEKIASALIADKLAACVTIVPGAHSIYRWEGKVETADETLLVAKTRADLFGPLNTKVKSLHSYIMPCIVAMPLVAGDESFFNWIASETAK